MCRSAFDFLRRPREMSRLTVLGQTDIICATSFIEYAIRGNDSFMKIRGFPVTEAYGTLPKGESTSHRLFLPKGWLPLALEPGLLEAVAEPDNIL